MSKKCKYGLLGISSIVFSSLSVGNALAITAETASPIKGRAPMLKLDSNGESGLFGVGYQTPDGKPVQDFTNIVIVENPEVDITTFNVVVKEPAADEFVDDDLGNLAPGTKPQDIGRTYFAKIVSPSTGTEITAPESPEVEWFAVGENDDLVKLSPKSGDSLCSLSRANNDVTKFKLKLKGSFALQTEYGDPNLSGPLTGSRTVDVSFDTAHCTLKENYGNLAYVLPLKNKELPSEDWERYKGFKVPGVGGKNFPTTAFRGAQFELVSNGTLLTSDYEWTTDRPDIISFDVAPSSKNSLVQFLGTDVSDDDTMHGKLPATVTITGKKAGQETIVYRFTIDKWFTVGNDPKVNGPMIVKGHADARMFCMDLAVDPVSQRGKYRLPTRAEFTNAEGAFVPPETGANTKGTYTRKIGGGLLAEWGAIKSSTKWPSGYHLSNLGSAMQGNYWTSEYSDPARDVPYFVTISNGAIEPATLFKWDQNIVCVNQ